MPSRSLIDQLELEFNTLKSFNHFYNYFVTQSEQRVKIHNCEYILTNVNIGMNGLDACHLEYIATFSMIILLAFK